MASQVFSAPSDHEVVGPRTLSLKILVCLGVLTGARLLAAAFIPLTEDEAYYRLWAEHLSAGYFDHPPMVAWWIAAGRSLVGDTALGARLVSVFATTLASLVIIDIGRTLGFSDQASERAGLWYNATILVALGGAVITPDAPATFFWTLTLWAVARAWRSKAGAWWIGAGAAAGLACLSKYSALFIGPGILLWLLCSQDGRRKLRRPWPWLALVVAVAAFSPNLIWNAGHHWLSFEKQFSRVTPSAFTPRHVLDVPATQFLLLNPLIASFAVLAILDLARGRNIRATSLLVVTGAPFAGYLCLHSLHAGVQAHWPAPLYPGAALLAASAAETRIAARWRTVAAAVPWFGFGVASVVLVHMALPQTDWLGRRDPVMPLRGWAAFAQSVETQRVRVGGGWVGTFSYGEAAELLDLRKSDAPILELIERERFLVLGQAPRLNGPGVVVDLRRRIAADDLQLCFGEVRRLADLERGDPGRPGIAYAVFYAAGPKLDLVNRGCRLGKDKPAASEP